MKHPSLDLEVEATRSPPPKSSRRMLLLVAALLTVALVNAARVVQVQGYFHLQLSQDETVFPASDEELPVKARPTPGCVKLDTSHVDPNFYHADVCLTRHEVLTIIKQLVFTAADVFDAHNVTYFLDSGTLLGAFRNQSVIVHDNDADVGIDAAGLAYLQNHPVEFPAEYAFTVWNSSLYPTSDRDDKLPARLVHRDSGIYVDVFAFLDWNDPETGQAKVGPLPSWCFMNCAGCPTVESGGKSLKVAKSWIYPLVNCTFEGRATLRCPRKTQQYLRYTFGKNYMTPVKYTYK